MGSIGKVLSIPYFNSPRETIFRTLIAGLRFEYDARLLSIRSAISKEVYETLLFVLNPQKCSYKIASELAKKSAEQIITEMPIYLIAEGMRN